MLKTTLGPAMLSLAILMTACSEAPKTAEKKATAKPPEPLTGRQAFQRMYPSARAWAPDALPLELRSIHMPQVSVAKGQAGAWQAIFVSASRSRSRMYTYSAVEADGNLHEGVFAGIEESCSPHGQSDPFEIAAITIDSDQAYDAAAEKSADYIKKNPDKPIMYILQRTRRFPDLTWRVIWGQSEAASDYSVFIDATTGKYLEKMH